MSPLKSLKVRTTLTLRASCPFLFNSKLLWGPEVSSVNHMPTWYISCKAQMSKSSCLLLFSFSYIIVHLYIPWCTHWWAFMLVYWYWSLEDNNWIDTSAACVEWWWTGPTWVLHVAVSPLLHSCQPALLLSILASTPLISILKDGLRASYRVT